jgi:predicted ATP-grasp superfamily ATP-dependent carboligase
MSRSSLPGVVILGGAHNALALARSFGRKGVPVTLVTDDHPLPKYSRYVERRIDWPGAKSADAATWLVELAARNGFQNWLLLPCADHEVRLVAENRTLLRTCFQILGNEWDDLQHLCNKQLLAQAAEKAGVAVPKSYDVNSVEDATRIGVEFPVILKPAMRMSRNALTSAKAWRADNRDELIEMYRRAAALQGEDGVVVQEYIPGGGEAQFSYAALWFRNAPVAELAARRTRQYPVDFGYTSTFVEIVANDTVMDMSRKLLSSIGFEGLVEVEFKRDDRTGTYKVLDVNPRAWSWLSLCEAGGFDFATSFADILSGTAKPVQLATPGHAWVHVSRDAAAALHLLARGQLNLGEWLKQYRQKLTYAIFAADDPLPALLELPMTLTRIVSRMLTKEKQPNALPAAQPRNATH